MKLRPLSAPGKLTAIILSLLLLTGTVFAADLNSIISQLQRQNWSGAIAEANSMSKTDPDNSTMYFLKGVAQYQQGDYHSSRENLSKAISLGKVSGEVYFYRGIDNLYLKDYKNSIRDFTTTLNDKNSAKKITNFSALLRSKDDPQQCLANIYTFRALANLNSGQYKDGLTDINKAFSIAVTLNHSSYKIKADLLFLNNQYQKSYTNYKKAIELNPGNADAYYGSGLIELYFGNYNKALKYFRKADNLDPENNDIEEKIGLCQLFSNNLNAALQTFISNYNSRPNAYNSVYLGYIYASLDNSAKATEYYQQALSLNPYIANIMTIIYNKLPESSPAKLQQQKIIESIKNYFTTKLKRELKITTVKLKPGTPRINQDFQIIIRISALFPAINTNLHIPFHFIIANNEKVLFTSETKTLKIVNGKAGEWIEQMNGVPANGNFTLTVITEHEKLRATKQIGFTIR